MSMDNVRIGKLALMLAMSDDEEEVTFKGSIKNMQGIKVAIKYISGKSSIIQTSIVKTIVNAALQAEVIENKPTQIHGLLHATLGAYTSLREQGIVVSDLKIKVSVVCDDRWVAVAMYGSSAFHYKTSHERASLHIMHI